MKKIIALILVLCICFMGVSAFTKTPDAILLQRISTSKITESNAASNVAAGGNITALNLEANISTNRWQGFVGNVTGRLKLGSGDNALIDFGNTPVNSVFVTTRQTNYNWGSLTPAPKLTLDYRWGFNLGKDRFNTVFNQQKTFEGHSNVPAITLNTHFSTGLFYNGVDTGKGDFMFHGNVSRNGNTGFDGGVHQFEIMVPTTTQGTDTFFFYMSIAE